MENPQPSKSLTDYPNTFPKTYIHSPKSYALSGKIMLGAIVVLFTVVLLILCLHIYARCFLLRRRRRQLLNRRRSRLVFVSNLQQTPSSAAPRGLDLAILRSLPVFSFSSKTHPEQLECAVCLSEFEEGEKGRLLPKCNHSFHTDCIDMWFHSHSTCPLCRSAVKPVAADLPPSAPENQVEVLVSGEGGSNSPPESNSGLCSSCQQTEELGVPSSSSSLRREESTASPSSFRKKAFGFVGVGIEVPRRNESFKGLEEEMGFGSPLRSPGSGILVLKRILSRERWGAAAAAAAAGSSSSSTGEIDIERGEEQSLPQQ